MKHLTKLTLASAAILASGSAFAIDSNDVPAANQLYISGATATNPALYQIHLLASGGICAPDTIDVYIDTAGPAAINADNQFMVACTGRAGTPFAGQDLLVAKESVGGSNNGTLNVARAPTDPNFELDFLDASNPACDAPVEVAATGALTGYNLHANCSGTVSRVPDAGVADVEAALFTNTTEADRAALSPQPLFQIVFAPAVSQNLRDALQAAQGLTVGDAGPVPNITRGQLHAIFSGEALFWDDFRTSTGANLLPGEDIYICRRGNSSGTQASFAAFVLNERCNASVRTFIGPEDPTCEAGGCDWGPAYFDTFVFAGNGSSDVRECLDYHNDNGNFAIGVLSTDTTVNDTSRQIRFIGIDGAPPTLASVANGGYHFVTENVLNIRGAGPTGVPGQVVSFIVDNIGEPSVIAQLNVASRNPGGDTGILGRANGVTIVANAPPVDQATMRVNPVSSFTRSGFAGVNNCQPQSATQGSQIIGGNQ